MPLTKEDVLEQWKNEKQLYDKLGSHVQSYLENCIRQEGISARIITRTKDDKSLIKKLYKKGFDQYDSIRDKCGARVICKFKQDTEIVHQIVKERFDVDKTDNKIHALNFDEQGYKSIHFDVKLKEERTEEIELYAELKDLYIEIQVRTNCEDTWAEIYHDVGYKADSLLHPEIKREFYCLAGLLEVADNNFANLNEKVRNIRVLNEDFVLSYLKTPFIKMIGNTFDYDFSYTNIELLLPLTGFKSAADFEYKMDEFLSTKETKSKLDFILNQPAVKSAEIPYLSQPEIFLIFYLIENDLHSLKDKWEHDLYMEDLSFLCTLWGVPLNDYCFDY
jgi:ppGpp synthetase/RelA/SpoT-type nucleotidyltranferase